MVFLLQENNIKFNKKKPKVEITISLLLHAILIYLLILNSFNKNIGPIESSKVGESAINIAISENNRLIMQNNHQQFTNKKHNEEKHENQSNHQIDDLYQKGIQKQEYTKQIKKKQLQVQEIVQDKTEQLKKENAIIKAKVEKKVQSKIQEKTKKSIKVEKKLSNQVHKKDYEENINDLFRDLSSSRNTPTIFNKENKILFKKDDLIQDNGSLIKDIDNYSNQIQTAIESHFYNSSFYKGKICTLRISLAPDGLLLDVQSEKGDSSLCAAAVSAAKKATIPKPPSQVIYEIFKNVLLDFKP